MDLHQHMHAVTRQNREKDVGTVECAVCTKLGLSDVAYNNIMWWNKSQNTKGEIGVIHLPSNLFSIVIYECLHKPARYGKS